MDSGVLPESWCVATLNDIARPFGGSTPSKSDTSFWTDGTVPWVSPKDMKVFDLRGSEDSVSQKALARLSLIPEGSILVVVRSGILSRILPVAINHLPVTINQDMRAFVPDREINARFIAWQLLANQREILAKCSKDGTTVASIEAVALASYPFALPPAVEQHRIVAKIEELFSELDQGVASLKTAREQIKVYRQSLLKNAFEGKLTAAWRAAHRDQLETATVLQQRIARERQARYQQHLADWQTAGKAVPKPKPPKPLPPLTAEELAELPELPVGWGWFKVNHLCDVVRGGSPRPAGDPKYYGGNIPFLKVADITRNPSPYLSTYSFTITEAGLNKTRQIEPNTLVLSNSGATLGVPKICLISATMNDGVAAFLGFPSDQLLYHYYFWQSQTEKLRNIDQGAAQPNLNTDLIKETLIPICSPAEQCIVTERLEAALSEADQLDQTLATALQQADALRQSILKKAFCGQLVAQDKNDEPATALLERIRAGKSNGMNVPRSRRKSG